MSGKGRPSLRLSAVFRASTSVPHACGEVLLHRVEILLAESLEMTGALGTRAEVDDADRYSGRLSGAVLHGSAKADAVEAHAREAGIDLGASVAYSDSIHDLPLLELVGRAEVVNPDRRLRRVA